MHLDYLLMFLAGDFCGYFGALQFLALYEKHCKRKQKESKDEH